jgi:hypothetical protein
MPLFPRHEVFAKQKLQVNKRHGSRLLTLSVPRRLSPGVCPQVTDTQCAAWMPLFPRHEVFAKQKLQVNKRRRFSGMDAVY